MAIPMTRIAEWHHAADGDYDRDAELYGGRGRGTLQRHDRVPKRVSQPGGDCPEATA